MPGGHRRDGRELRAGQRREQARRVGVVHRVAVVVVAQQWAQEQGVRGGGADARHLHFGLVLGMVVCGFPEPAVTEAAFQPGGHRQGFLGGAVHAVAQAVGLFRGELPRPDFVALGADVVEDLVAVVVGRLRVVEFPAHVVAGDQVAVGAGQQLDRLPAQLHVGEPGQRVRQLILERAVHVHALALVLDGPVRDRALAAAVLAVVRVFRQHRAAFVEARHRRAAILRRHVEVVVPVIQLRG